MYKKVIGGLTPDLTGPKMETLKQMCEINSTRAKQCFPYSWSRAQPVPGTNKVRDHPVSGTSQRPCIVIVSRSRYNGRALQVERTGFLPGVVIAGYSE